MCSINLTFFKRTVAHFDHSGSQVPLIKLMGRFFCRKHFVTLNEFICEITLVGKMNGFFKTIIFIHFLNSYH